ncbi:DUF58 domain-containing protein [Roseibacillus persicicus]|uniref:DUF58 domain-containing protein n=1 Tax=Roseibacillus persicicus TaxID=454148 RepID=A0A918WH47_9BACT|nr:DUF58 domain-containing protein [Roseibacillus persicicus]GHC47027.1 hypothetical protein GCM10007100_10940 [Roseibacillus persicicus]
MSDDLKLPDCLSLLSEETMGALRRIEWQARKRKQGTLTGRHSSPDKGASVEFAEHREYAPGDDTRNLDWRVMAKSDRNVIRQYIEETNLRATLAVDLSGSMGYQGDQAELSKVDYAKQLAAALAYIFVKQGDGAGLVTFDSSVKTFLRSGSRPSQVRQILEELYPAEAGSDTDLGGVLHEVAERIPRRGLVVLVSDLFDEPDKIVEALHHFDYRQHELVVFHLLAEEELTFPFKKFQRFKDLEGVEEMLRIDPQAVRAAYLERLRAFVKRIESACGKMRADYVAVNTKTPVRDTLLEYFGGRR